MTIKAIVFDAYGTLYDVQSVARVTEQTFPGHGETITQIWRLKQLEYTWLRSLMGRYSDFRVVTRDSLIYTLGAIGLTPEAPVIERIVEEYNRLLPYPDAADALAALQPYQRAILSNGSPDMLDALVRHSGLDRHLDTVLSVDASKVFKPDPRAYELVQRQLGVQPREVVFVSSNGFDVAGGKSFGFQVVRIERVTAESVRQELNRRPIGPASLFRALRTQPEVLPHCADAVISSLTALPDLVSALDKAG